MMSKIKYTQNKIPSTSSFLFDHVIISAEEQITLHKQDTWELSYIMRGSGTRYIGDKTELFSKGEVVLIPPHIPHCWSFDKLNVDNHRNIENITLTFDEEFLRRCSLNFPELKESISSILNYQEAISFEGNSLNKLQHLLYSMINSNIVQQLSVVIQILELLSHYNDIRYVGKLLIEDNKKKRMQKIFMFVMNNYHNPITLSDIARLVELDKSSFCVFFKKITKSSFINYLINYRIEIACQMLSNSEMNISEICYACGFRDIPYFNRVFKKLKKMTPSQYKRTIIGV